MMNQIHPSFSANRVSHMGKFITGLCQTKPFKDIIPAHELDSKLMDMSINQMTEKMNRKKSENQATYLEQDNINKIGEEGETRERGQEGNEEVVEGESHRETLAMQTSNNDAHYHHDGRNSPVGISINCTAQQNVLVHSDSLEEYKTPSASSGTSPNHHSSPRKVHCSNCPCCEKVKQLEEGQKKQREIYQSLLNEEEQKLAVMTERLQERIQNENYLVEQLNIIRYTERKRMLILEHTKNRELQKMKKEKERAEKGKEWAENERDEAERDTERLEKELLELRIYGEIKPNKSLQYREIPEDADQDGSMGCQLSGIPHSGHQPPPSAASTPQQHQQPPPGAASTPQQHHQSPPGADSTL